MKRLLLALLFSLVATFALFWLMQWMISSQQQSQRTSEKLLMTEFVRLKKESAIQTKQRKLPDPPPEKQPPPPPPTAVQSSPVASQANTPQIDMPALDIPLTSARFAGPVVSGLQMGKGKTGAISTNLIPLVRIPPRYPMRAARRGIEGWVKIEFTITEQGAVKDAVVVESHPANVFDRAALNAIRKWKFKPKIIDGVPFEQRAVQILKFKLSK